MKILVSASNALSLLLFPSYALPLLQSGDVPTGNSPSWTYPVWVSPMGTVLHKLLAWVISLECSPAETDCLRLGPPSCHKSYQQACSIMGSSLLPSAQFVPEACSSVGFPQGHIILEAFSLEKIQSLQLLFWHLSAPFWSHIGATGGYLFFHGLQGDGLPHYVLHHRLQRDLCSCHWSTSSFTNTGVSLEAVSLTWSYLSSLDAVAQFISPILKHVITVASSVSVTGLALTRGGSILK